MEWSIKSASRQCFVTGEFFREGDSVISIIGNTDSGEIVRFDVLEKNIPSFTFSGKILGQWRKTISDSGKSLPAQSAAELAHKEDFFISLFEGEISREKEILKQLFALLLEKKRILRASGNLIGNKQKFIHLKTKNEFLVPMDEILPEDLTSLENIFEMFT